MGHLLARSVDLFVLENRPSGRIIVLKKGLHEGPFIMDSHDFSTMRHHCRDDILSPDHCQGLHFVQKYAPDPPTL